MASTRKHWCCDNSRLLWMHWYLPAMVLLSIMITTSECTVIHADVQRRLHTHHNITDYSNSISKRNNISNNPTVAVPSKQKLLSSLQMQPSAFLGEKGSSQWNSCPNCVVFNNERENIRSRATNSNSDYIRLEAIKRQILSKLGLKTKPNVTSPVPRDVVLATLYRAGETRKEALVEQQETTQKQQKNIEEETVPPTTKPLEPEPDDFYGKTSEIITFAEPDLIIGPGVCNE